MRRMIPTKTIDVLSNIAYDNEKKAVEIGTNLEVDGVLIENGTLPKTSIQYNTTGSDIFNVGERGDGVYDISVTAESGSIVVQIPLNYIIITQPFNLSEMISNSYILSYSLINNDYNSIEYNKAQITNGMTIIVKGIYVYIQFNAEV